MPTNMPNRAQITFNGSDVVLSNETNTTLVNRFSMNITKDSVSSTVIPGGSASYVVRMDNTGEGTLYNPALTDDLGGGVLTYEDGSARFYKNGDPVTGTATVNGPEELVFSVNTTLEENDSLTIIYAATVRTSQADNITNTISATARGGSADGCEVTDTDPEEITVRGVASVSIFKTASEETVSCGDTLTYTFTLMNSGREAAENITFTDALPEQFRVTAVSYTTGGATTPINPSDYTVTLPNTLTIPAAGSSLEISVPAATDEGPGITTITVTGTIG